MDSSGGPWTSGYEPILLSSVKPICNAPYVANEGLNVANEGLNVASEGLNMASEGLNVANGFIIRILRNLNVLKKLDTKLVVF